MGRSLVGNTARNMSLEITEGPVGFCSYCVAHQQSHPNRTSTIPHLVVSPPSFAPPLTSRNCQCGHRLDKFGHHRAACSKMGVLGKRGFPLECAAAQVCREAGGRVSTNVFVRDLDLAAFNALDNRRVEVIAEGLPLWHGAQLAIDTTLVSPLRGDGSARGRAADHSGSTLQDARRRKERDLPCARRRCRASPSGGSCRGGGRQVVGGNSPVPSWVGQGSCGFGATPLPRQSEGGVVASLELSACMQCDWSFRVSWRLARCRALGLCLRHMRC